MSNNIIPLHSPHDHFITPADPAAGAPLIVPLMDGYEWSLISLWFTFTTDANPADRYPYIRFVEPTSGEAYRCASSIAHAASLARIYCFGSGGSIGQSSGGPSSIINVAAGDAGPVIRASTFYLIVQNIQATDQIAAARITFRITPVMTV